MAMAIVQFATGPNRFQFDDTSFKIYMIRSAHSAHPLPPMLGHFRCNHSQMRDIFTIGKSQLHFLRSRSRSVPFSLFN